MMVMAKTAIIIRHLQIGASPEPTMANCKGHENLAPSLTELRVWLEGGRQQ